MYSTLTNWLPRIPRWRCLDHEQSTVLQMARGVPKALDGRVRML